MPTSTDESGLTEETVDAFIKEEGFWEQGMDREQKMELYRIVQLSKHTALEEERVRRGGGVSMFHANREDREILWQASPPQEPPKAMSSSTGPVTYPQTFGQNPQAHPPTRPNPHQDSPQASTEPPIRTHRKKHFNSHNRQDLSAVLELRLTEEDDLVLPDLDDPRGVTSETGGLPASRLSLHIAGSEDINRGVARIDEVLQMCHHLCTKSTPATAEHVV